MKKILIAFKTRHGCTEYVANMMETRLEGKITLWNLSQKGLPDISDYDTVIVGGSIHAGRIQGKVKRFITKKMGGVTESVSRFDEQKIRQFVNTLNQ